MSFSLHTSSTSHKLHVTASGRFGEDPAHNLTSNCAAGADSLLCTTDVTKRGRSYGQLFMMDGDTAAEALRLSWSRLSRHTNFQDMLTCLLVNRQLRKTLQQTSSECWRTAAEQSYSVSGVAAVTVQQVCCQVQRCLRARATLPSCRFELWQQAVLTKAAILSATLAPCSSFLALVCIRHVLVCKADSSTQSTLTLGRGWQSCCAAFSSDSRLLAVLSHAKRCRIQLQILDVGSQSITSHTEALHGSLVCEAVRCYSVHNNVAVHYSCEHGDYDCMGLLLDWQSCAVIRRASLPLAWLQQPEPKFLQACFSPDLKLIAAIPATAPASVVLHDALSHACLCTVLMHKQASTLLWLSPDKVLVRGHDAWLGLVDTGVGSITWTAEVPRHFALWPCLGAGDMVLESRQALGDLAASRQLWVMCKATGLRRQVAAGMDLHAVRIQHCSMHPSGLAVCLVTSVMGRSGKTRAMLQPLQTQTDLDGAGVELADWQPKATSEPVACTWSCDGTLLLMTHGRTAVLADFGI